MERQVTMNHSEGFHARPASDFVEAAIQLKSKIEVVFQDKTANAKSMLSLLKLGIEQGQSVVLRAEGPDAEEALETLGNIFENKQ
ncbi:HPr family phosphocarrier protein [Paenibacillus solisilvae]|uniref:HPr family phosphocarrier protein n=1 Tax=Paenibacillus solisilvae TaxID=2486751 RepID=A0ABW0W229_9BACL